MVNDSSSKPVNEKQHNSLSLKAALVIAVIISIIFVIISYWLYVKNPDYKYDLARPDVKRTVDISEDSKIDDETSPVDISLVKKTQEFIKTQLTDIEALDNFDQKALNDKTLFLER